VWKFSPSQGWNALLMQDSNELPYVSCAIMISDLTLSETGEANCSYFSSFKITWSEAMTEEFQTGSTSIAKIS
jgi:hypothetical protein